MKLKKSMLKELKTLSYKNFIALTIAGIVNAIGVTIFLSSVNLYDSGLSGTAILLSKLDTKVLTFSVYLLILNIPFFIFGFKRLGVNFTIYSLYAIAIYSLASFVIQHLLNLDFSNGSPIAGNDMLLCALFGGLISGVGSGLTIRYGGAIDGVEVLAVVFAKYLNLTVGSFVMVYNCILYIVAAVIFKSWQIPLYSIITYAIGIKAVDFVIEGLDKAKSAQIVTSKPTEVADELSNQFGRGITIIKAHGYHSKEEKIMLICVVNRFQVAKLKRAITMHDPNAFVTITDVSDTLGASLKFKSNKKKKFVPTMKINIATKKVKPMDKMNDRKSADNNIEEKQ